MEVPKIYPRSNELKFETVRYFDWEGDILNVIDEMVSTYGDATDREIVGHYQVDCTELREFVEAKRAGKVLRPARRGCWHLHKDGSGTCSECNRVQLNCWDLDGWDNYCHHCGASMEEAE